MSQQKRKMSADEEPTDSPQTKDQESAEPNGTSTATQKVKRLRHHVHHRSKGHLYYRNLYESGVELDFQELAEMDPEFKANAKYVSVHLFKGGLLVGLLNLLSMPHGLSMDWLTSPFSD